MQKSSSDQKRKASGLYSGDFFYCSFLYKRRLTTLIDIQRRSRIDPSFQLLTEGCLESTLGCLDVTLGCLDVALGCLHVTLGSLDVTLGCLDVTLGCLDVRMGCLEA